jgi:hypothetical protein
MILDSRIKEGKRPLTCIDVEQAREFEGKQCLFSDSYVNYKNIREYAEYPQYTGVLHIEEDTKRFRVNEDYVFRNGTDGYCYSLCLPLDWIKEPKAPEFVPYTLDTWEHEFNPGDVITFRGKVGTDRAGRQYKCIYAGWRQVISSDITQDATVTVALGLWGYTFKDLSELYEIYRDNTWEPFGRKVETIDLNKCH